MMSYQEAVAFIHETGDRIPSEDAEKFTDRERVALNQIYAANYKARHADAARAGSPEWAAVAALERIADALERRPL